MSNKEKVINIIMGMTANQIDDFCKYVKKNSPELLTPQLESAIRR